MLSSDPKNVVTLERYTVPGKEMVDRSVRSHQLLSWNLETLEEFESTMSSLSLVPKRIHGK